MDNYFIFDLSNHLNTKTMTQIAHTADFISCTFAGYGHKSISILIDGELHKFTTSAMYLTDMLQDDDDDIVTDGKQQLIDNGLRDLGFSKADNFKYFL